MRQFLEVAKAALLVIQVPLGLLLFIVVLSSQFYESYMCEQTCFIEAWYFSLQTVTTVGYGNWQRGLPDLHPSVLKVKMLALPTMVGGAAFFTFIISALTNFYWEQHQRN